MTNDVNIWNHLRSEATATSSSDPANKIDPDDVRFGSLSSYRKDGRRGTSSSDHR